MAASRANFDVSIEVVDEAGVAMADPATLENWPHLSPEQQTELTANYLTKIMTDARSQKNINRSSAASCRATGIVWFN